MKNKLPTYYIHINYIIYLCPPMSMLSAAIHPWFQAGTLPVMLSSYDAGELVQPCCLNQWHCRF